MVFKYIETKFRKTDINIVKVFHRMWLKHNEKKRLRRTSVRVHNQFKYSELGRELWEFNRRTTKLPILLMEIIQCMRTLFSSNTKAVIFNFIDHHVQNIIKRGRNAYVKITWWSKVGIECEVEPLINLYFLII